eukprot:GHRR01009672.1.p1 GENE.GHRR01009672.1~~GHRR01009672.1.p1  ORF type:complete len:721 (+),score=226.02 GHRR01009672.1:221-2383(+)
MARCLGTTARNFACSTQDPPGLYSTHMFSLCWSPTSWYIQCVPLLHSAVPGQAFHDWRQALLAANFSSSSSSEASNDWVNIVGLRETLTTIAGPPPFNSTHPVAEARLAAALKNRTSMVAAIWQAEQANEVSVYGASVPELAAATAVAEPGVTVPGMTAEQQQGQQWTQQQQLGQRMDKQTSLDSSSGNSRSDSNRHSTSTSSTDGWLSANSAVPTQEELEATLMCYVRRASGRSAGLRLNDKPWLLAGFDFPQALTLAVQVLQRDKVIYLMDKARELGLNTMRFWAFAEGGVPGVGSAVPGGWSTAAYHQQQQHHHQQHDNWAGDPVTMQPAPGVLNATVLSAGLDWLVHEAGKRGLKLVPVMTNGGSTANGGMKQYTDWVDQALTITDFYSNDTVKSVFLDYLAGLLSHTSSYSGIPLREEPIIAAWQLAETPSHPGHVSSEPLLGWMRQMGVFMKQKAPHHLLLSGLEGYFGLSSPHLLQYNPHAQVFDSASHSPHTYNSVCHGEDFWLHHRLAEYDVSTAAIFPDKWLACNESCKLDWTKQWIRAHLREAIRLQKPLLLGGIGALRPHSWRQAVLGLVRREVQRALERGHPIAGFILSGLHHPDMPDNDGWGIYDSVAAVDAPRPSLTNPSQQALQDVTWQRFMNHYDYLACLAQQARDPSGGDGKATNAKAWVAGWDLVYKTVSELGQLAQDFGGVHQSRPINSRRKQQPAVDVE